MLELDIATAELISESGVWFDPKTAPRRPIQKKVKEERLRAKLTSPKSKAPPKIIPRHPIRDPSKKRVKALTLDQLKAKNKKRKQTSYPIIGAPKHVIDKYKKAGLALTPEDLDDNNGVPQVPLNDTAISGFIAQMRLVINGKRSTHKDLKSGGSELGYDMMNHIGRNLIQGKGKISVAVSKKLLSLWNECFEKEGSSSMQDVIQGSGLDDFLEYYLKTTSGKNRAAAVKSIFMENPHIMSAMVESTKFKKLITSEVYNDVLAKVVSRQKDKHRDWLLSKILMVGLYGGLRYMDMHKPRRFVTPSLENISAAVSIKEVSFDAGETLRDLLKCAIKDHGSSKAIAAFCAGLSANSAFQEKIAKLAKMEPAVIPSMVAQSSLSRLVFPVTKKSFKSKSSNSIDLVGLSDLLEASEPPSIRKPEYLDIDEVTLISMLSSNVSYVEPVYFMSESASYKEQRIKQANERFNKSILEILTLLLKNAKTRTDLESIGAAYDARRSSPNKDWWAVLPVFGIAPLKLFVSKINSVFKTRSLTPEFKNKRMKVKVVGLGPKSKKK